MRSIIICCNKDDDVSTIAAACPWGTPPSWYRRKRTGDLLPVRQNTPHGRGRGRKGDARNLIRSPLSPDESMEQERHKEPAVVDGQMLQTHLV